MSTGALTRVGRHQIRLHGTGKPVHSNSLKIRLTHNAVIPNVTKVEKIILDNVKVSL